MDTRAEVRRILTLVAIAVAMRAWVVVHTIVPAQDGFSYIRLAQQLDGGATIERVAQWQRQPLYPVVLSYAHRGVTAIRGHEEPDNWRWAGQLVSVVASVLAVVPMYYVGRELFDARIAWLGTAIFNFLPVVVQTTSDVLAEATYLLLFVTGLWAVVAALNRRQVGWMVGAGAASGLAYLARPEGVVLPIAALGALAWVGWRRREGWNWRQAAMGGALVVAGFAVPMVPYGLAGGKLLGKVSVGQVLGRVPPSPVDSPVRDVVAAAKRPTADAGSAKVPSAKSHRRAATAGEYLAGARRLGAELSESLLYVGGPFALFAIVGWGVPRARRPGVVAVGVFLVIWLAALVRLYATAGYISGRYTLAIAALATLWAAVGMEWFIGVVTRVVYWVWGHIVRRAPRLEYERARRAAFVGALGVWAVACLWPLRASMHETRWGLRRAAGWLAAHTPADAMVLDTHQWAAFYAGRRSHDHRDLQEAVNDPRFSYIVVEEGELHGPWKYAARMRAVVGEQEPLASFQQASKGRGDKLLIFQYVRPVADKDRGEGVSARHAN